jgi:HPt (histidine-containing phosphotransfer) domain-containing protein
MNHTGEDSSKVIFDTEELLVRVDNDRELLRDLLVIFREEFPRILRTLREAVEAQDGNRVATAAHNLKGMLLNLAANQAAITAGRLEQLGRRGEASRYAEVFAVFEGDTGKLLPQLDACMAEVCR